MRGAYHSDNHVTTRIPPYVPYLHAALGPHYSAVNVPCRWSRAVPYQAIEVIEHRAVKIERKGKKHSCPNRYHRIDKEKEKALVLMVSTLLFEMKRRDKS